MDRTVRAATSRDSHLTLRRVERHQRIVEILAGAERPWPAFALAERLGVSRRTVERDLERLRLSGVPIASRRGPAGGAVLDARPGIRRFEMSVTEVAALLASMVALGPSATDAASSATATLGRGPDRRRLTLSPARHAPSIPCGACALRERGHRTPARC